MAQNGLIEPPALTSVFIVFVYSATQVYASDPFLGVFWVFFVEKVEFVDFLFPNW